MIQRANRPKTALTTLLLIFTLTYAVLPFTSVSSATAYAVAEDAGFSVHAQIPENQINKNLTYFDLHMKPGAKQTLTVSLINDSKKPLTVDVGAISASTNRNGIIDYRTPDIKDKTLKVPFSEISHVVDDTVTIPAGGTAAAHIEITMPAGVYDGVALGGIVITKKPDKDSASGSTSRKKHDNFDVSIKNEYSYIIGVKLRETEVPVSPDFEYEKVEAGLANYKLAVIHHIRNKEAAIVKDMRLSIKVYKGKEETPYIDFEKTVDMAPNSVMPIGTETGRRKFDPGDYLSKVRLAIGDKIWEFEKSFTVTEAEAKELNEKSVAETKPADIPFWFAAILIGGALLAFLAFLLFIISLLRRRKNDDEE
ncbi:MAG: DUF916 and DUF3324 domain-containing protein [Clostridiales Family XIII bacterium]|nr:DUF916 and DUF3324 domain-containing protein [Clostridiales Family XIII bacterium]